jgi:arsenate reductase-like glutaredoxin family protein
MPAPLGKMPTKKMPKIEVFGLDDSQPTRAAVRFFRERRIVVRFVDLRKKRMDAGELRQFVSRLGAAALLETDSRSSTDAGSADITTDLGNIVARIHADVRLLRLPLVRYGDDVTVGQDEATWRAWLARRNR